MGSDIPTWDLFTVPILYSMDKHETKGGHMTETMPINKPRPLAWEKGSISNFPQKATTWSKTTRIQCNGKIEKPTNPLIREGKKRAERDHQQKYGFSNERAKNKRHKGLAVESKPTTPTAAAAPQPRQTPWPLWAGFAKGLGIVEKFKYLHIW